MKKPFYTEDENILLALYEISSYDDFYNDKYPYKLEPSHIEKWHTAQDIRQQMESCRWVLAHESMFDFSTHMLLKKTNTTHQHVVDLFRKFLYKLTTYFIKEERINELEIIVDQRNLFIPFIDTIAELQGFAEPSAYQFVKYYSSDIQQNTELIDCLLRNATIVLVESPQNVLETLITLFDEHALERNTPMPPVLALLEDEEQIKRDYHKQIFTMNQFAPRVKILNKIYEITRNIV